ncbi:MAG: hypothetical protein QXX79_00880 [Candidatus Bathyarchaeia archaeon]
MRSLKNVFEPCQYYYADMVRHTLPDPRLALPLRRRWWNLKRRVWYISILGLRGYLSKMFPSTTLGKLIFGRKSRSRINKDYDALNLQPGEWVEVRSVKEIFATLDAQGKLKGLRFTPEMVKFCGKRFRVYKRLEKIILEATGELRRIKTPTVLLEGVFCDGKAHGGCDRSCFCFWREAWLKRASPPSERENH